MSHEAELKHKTTQMALAFLTLVFCKVLATACLERVSTGGKSLGEKKNSPPCLSLVGKK